MPRNSQELDALGFENVWALRATIHLQQKSTLPSTPLPQVSDTRHGYFIFLVPRGSSSFSTGDTQHHLSICSKRFADGPPNRIILEKGNRGFFYS